MLSHCFFGNLRSLFRLPMSFRDRTQVFQTFERVDSTVDFFLGHVVPIETYFQEFQGPPFFFWCNAQIDRHPLKGLMAESLHEQLL